MNANTSRSFVSLAFHSWSLSQVTMRFLWPLKCAIRGRQSNRCLAARPSNTGPVWALLDRKRINMGVNSYSFCRSKSFDLWKCQGQKSITRWATGLEISRRVRQLVKWSALFCWLIDHVVFRFVNQSKTKSTSVGIFNLKGLTDLLIDFLLFSISYYSAFSII